MVVILTSKDLGKTCTNVMVEMINFSLIISQFQKNSSAHGTVLCVDVEFAYAVMYRDIM
jgi:hypothetical protein